tara:strand:- start:580 stop:1476 length:897 start_codon:yes stop_codon:yes gene_type:complete
MRDYFFNYLFELMKEVENTFLVVADMGMGLIEPFQESFPKRFINIGIAEQNLVGICAGLCNAGFKPFCYTISNFLVQRSLEQIRNDICLHNYPVTLVGTSTGYDNGKLGPTHHVIDDYGVVKTLPNISIYSPTSIKAVELSMIENIRAGSPSYIRLGKSDYDIAPISDGVNYFVKKEEDKSKLIIVHGTVLENVMEAVKEDYEISVFCMNKIKPMNEQTVNYLFSNFQKIIVIEDHSLETGLYNTLCQEKNKIKSKKNHIFTKIAPPSIYQEIVGDKSFYDKLYGLDPKSIKAFIKTI